MNQMVYLKERKARKKKVGNFLLPAPILAEKKPPIRQSAENDVLRANSHEKMQFQSKEIFFETLFPQLSLGLWEKVREVTMCVCVFFFFFLGTSFLPSFLPFRRGMPVINPKLIEKKSQ